MKITREKSNGITLVALIVTIIILLILAGVSISSLTGNGLFEKTIEAKKRAAEEEIREHIKLIIYETQVKLVGKVTMQDIVESLNNDEKYEYEIMIKEAATDISDSDNIIIKTREYIYKVDKNFEVAIVEKTEGYKQIAHEGEIENNKKYIFKSNTTLNDNIQFVGWNESSSEYSNSNPKYLYLNSKASTYNTTYIGTENKIDLTGYDIIKCKVSTGEKWIDQNYLKLVLNDQQINEGTPQYSSEQIGANQTDYILEFFIPGDCINSEYYIGVLSTLQNVKIYEIWLEKATKTVLYDNGILKNGLTEIIGTNDANSEYRINDNNLYMNVINKYYNFTYIGFNNKIDLTEYKRIGCIVSTGNASDGAGNYMGISLNSTSLPNKLDQSGLAYKSPYTYNNNTNKTIFYNIPTECRNDQYYIGFFACVKDTYIYKVWLEK